MCPPINNNSEAQVQPQVNQAGIEQFPTHSIMYLCNKEMRKNHQLTSINHETKASKMY